MDNYIEEQFIEKSPNPITIDGTENILYQMKNCICKIINNNGKKGTGFFCRIPYNDKLLPVLITNYHIINENIYDKKAKIELTLNDDKKAIILKLDNSRIKFTNKDLDVSIIEIKQKIDNINHFLDIDDNINTNLEYVYNNKSVYILHYPKGSLANVSYGLSNQIIDNNCYHFCSTEEGSSGAPILLLDSFKVIGIHKGGPNNKNFKFNLGTYIKSAIQLFNIENDINNKYNASNEVNYQNNNNQEMSYFNENKNYNMNNMNNIRNSKSQIYNQNYNNLIGSNQIYKNIEKTEFDNFAPLEPIFQEGPKRAIKDTREENRLLSNYFGSESDNGFIMDSNAFLTTSKINEEINEGTIVRPPIYKNNKLKSIFEPIKVLPTVYRGTKSDSINRK